LPEVIVSLHPTVRALAIGVVAAAVVVGSYAIGHGGRTAAALQTPATSAPASVVKTTGVAPADSSSAPAAVTGGISVGGTGRVTGKPNLLRLDTSISVTKPTVTDAMQVANTTMAAVQRVLKADGVADADLQTSGLSVQPNYDYSNSTRRLLGYGVSENLSVVLRDLAKAGATISDAAQAGGDALQIGGASLDLDQDGALIAQARQAAFADAEAKAKAYATAAGRQLGAVTSISESTQAQPQPIRYPAAASLAADGKADVPIQAGSQDVTVDVAVNWAIN
jgi:uncharacterized protein YggE